MKKFITAIVLLFSVESGYPASMGDFLALRGEYLPAVIEYERQLFFGDFDSADELIFKISKCYFKLDSLEAAREAILRLINNGENSEYDTLGFYYLAVSYWSEYDYENFRLVMENLRSFTSLVDTGTVDYIIGWSCLYEGDIERGKKYIGKSGLSFSHDFIKELETIRDLPSRDIKIASLLSFISPSLSHIYSGNYSLAFISLLFPGLVGVSVVKDFVDGCYGIGLFKYFFVYVRYSKGSALRAIRDVQLHNVRIMSDFFRKLRRKYPPPEEKLRYIFLPYQGKDFL